MPETTEPNKIHGWESIAGHLGCSPKTARKREIFEGLPVHDDGGGDIRRRVFAYAHELDRWKSERYGSRTRQRVTVPSGRDVLAAPVSAQRGRTLRRHKIRVAVAIAILTILVIISGHWYGRTLSGTTWSLSAPKLLTANGHEKYGILSYANQLYFGQEQDGWLALAQMSASGGPVHVLWNPPANVRPIDISPDGQQILATVSKGVERERELWIVPLDRGMPQRLLNITAHAAAWSPDGGKIAIAAANEVYLYVPGQPSALLRIASLTGVPREVFWTADGHRLQFLIADAATDRINDWGYCDLDGRDSPTITIRHLPTSVRSSDSWSHFNGWISYLFPHEDGSSNDTSISTVTSSTAWWLPRVEIRPVAQLPGQVAGVAFNSVLSQLFVLSQPVPRTGFILYDPHTKAFRNILPNVSGVYLDYSRDGRWVAYSSFGQNSLWISRADGRDARQLTFPPEAVELPRWSPNGKEIAYMSQRPGEPWRIRIWHLETSTITDAARGNDNQGAPTWSNDGRSLVYGSVMCEATHTCAVHRIHLATGEAEIVPGSEGLFTARWSPDGRWVAAIDLDKHRLMLFNLRTGLWHPLADSVYSPDMSWSWDSRYLYICAPGGKARIDQVQVDTGRRESVLDLFAQDRLNLTETADLQFSIAPDSSIVLQRRLHSQEIYVYNFERK